MGRYFDYSDWELDEVCDSIRTRLAEARTPLPKKIIKHHISIRYKTGEGSYSYGYAQSWTWNHDEFTNIQQAVDYIESRGWIEKIGDNMWADICLAETYKSSDGKNIPCHYEIVEYDNEEYEDGEHHTEYTKDDIEALSESLKQIEIARCHLRAYDRAENNGSVENGSYIGYLQEEIDKFNKEYTEELPENYYDNDD